MTNVVLSILSMADVVMLSRLNVRLGIPDDMMVVGGSVLQTVVGQWMWMPGVVILSQLCPKGMEATMYALLAGCHNLATPSRRTAVPLPSSCWAASRAAS